MIDLHVSKRMQTGRPACAMHTCNKLYLSMNACTHAVCLCASRVTEGSYANYIS